MAQFLVKVSKGSKLNEVKTEKIDTLPELKSFLYGIMMTRKEERVHAMAYSGNDIIVQESGEPMRTYGNHNFPQDVKFLKRVKKSHYA